MLKSYLPYKVLGGVAFVGQLGHKDGSFVNEVKILIKETTRDTSITPFLCRGTQ